MPHECTNCGRQFADGSKEMLSGCPDCGGNKFQFTPSSDRGSTATTGAEEATTAAGETGTTTGGTGTTLDGTATSSTTGDTSSTGETGPSAGGDRSGGDHGAWPDPDGTMERRRTDAEHSDTSDSTDESTRGRLARYFGRSSGEDDTEDSTAGNDFPDAGDSTPARGRPDDEAGTGASDDVAHVPGDGETHTPGVGQEATDPDDGEPIPDDREDHAQASARSDVVSPDELPERSPDPGTDADEDRPATDDGRVVDTPDEDDPDLADLRAELNDQFESIKILQPGQYEINLMELFDREEYIISLQEDGRYVIEVPESWRDDVPER